MLILYQNTLSKCVIDERLILQNIMLIFKSKSPFWKTYVPSRSIRNIMKISSYLISIGRSDMEMADDIE